MSSRFFTILVLCLGTICVSRVCDAQSATLIADLRAAEGSSSSSAPRLLALITASQLNTAVIVEAQAFRANPSTVPLAGDLTYILNTLPATVTTRRGATPLPSDANAYISLINDVFETVTPSVLAAGGNAAYLAYQFAANPRLVSAIGGDMGKADIAYYIGAALDVNGADNSVAPVAAMVASQLSSTGTALAYYQSEVAIYGAYPAAAKPGDNPGIVPLVANAVAFQSIGANYTPNPSAEALIATSLAGSFKSEAVETATCVEENTLLLSNSSAAAGIAAIFATDLPAEAPQIAAQAAIAYPNEATAISAAVANAVPAYAAAIATDVVAAVGSGGTGSAAAIVSAIDAAPNISTLKSADTLRETVAQDVIALAPTQDAAVAVSTAPTLSSDLSRATLAYDIAEQDAGLVAVNGVTLSQIYNIPAVTQAIEASIPASDPYRAYYAGLIAEYAAYPLCNQTTISVPPLLYTTIAVTAAQAQVGGNLPASVQAAIAGGVDSLFATTNSIAITTATAVEANALSAPGVGSVATAPSVVAAFASNATLGPEAQYLAAQAAVQYPADVAAISGSAATVQPGYAAITGYQVALVTSTANYVAVANAIAEAPGVAGDVSKTGAPLAESIRETLAQDIIAANPSADAAGEDALVAGAIGADLTLDVDRATLAYYLGDQEAGVDEFFTPPAGASTLNLPQDVAAVTAALASDETATGSTLASDEATLAEWAAYQLSALDKANPNAAADEVYIAQISAAVVGTMGGDSTLGITTQAVITSTMVAEYGTELSGSVGTQIAQLDFAATQTQVAPINVAPITTTPITTTSGTGTDWYVSQSGAGAQNGMDAADSLPLSWLNWGAAVSIINPGDTVHLCGTITSQLGFYYTGVSGSPITLYFEPGAQLSQPGTSSGALLTIPNQSYVVIDGGSNGIIQNTDNGTNLDNHNATSGINASGSSNLEIRNLTFANLYVHVAGADNSTSFASSGAVYMNGGGNNISVHDCVFHDMSECVYITASGTGINIYNDNFSNYNHGAEGLTGSNINIYNNTFGSTANWDTNSDAYHHDGVFLFGASSNVNVFGNVFEGNWGNNNTAHIFLDSASLTNIAVWNNVFLQYPGNYLSNGFLAGGAANLSIFNNTFAGSGVANSCAIATSGSNMSIVNNIISGVTTFLSLGSTTAWSSPGLNNNLYANVTPGGNAPFSFGGVSYNNLQAWQAATGGDANSSTVSSALLAANGQLEAGSPAIGAGANLSAYFDDDIAGNVRSNTWDIGAWMYIP